MAEDNLFGSAFETSLRILVLLDELSEVALDEQQICCIDFISVYGADFGLLDKNLHGNGIFRFSEFPAKSALAIQAVKNLVLNSLITFIPVNSGYTYLISPLGKEVSSRISDVYVGEYRIAVKEVHKAFPSLESKQLQYEIYKNTINSLEATIDE